ncbi:MAG: hypothetical protein HY286_08380 [Planctomycetes bacterium]|nr:hypothetical protein [Planctomycetota bacterium]
MIRIAICSVLLTITSWTAAPPVAGGGPNEEIPFESLGKELLAACDAKRDPKDPAPPKDATPSVLLLSRIQPVFHRIPLGAVEIWELKNNFGDLSKSEKGEPVALANLQAHANLCLQTQKLWIDRADLDDPTRMLIKKNFTLAENWIKAWKVEGPTRPKLEEEQAIQQIGAAYHALKKDQRLEIGALPVLFILNTRRQYFSLLGAAGIVDPTLQKLLWDPKARTWVIGGIIFRCNATCASWGPAEGRGSPMLDNPMPAHDAQQYITHQIAHNCIDLMMHEAPPWASEGLAICDTIQIMKADETHCTGNIAAAFVADVGGFMPGQKEDFRWMPTAPAEKSPYRRGPSMHFFTKELQRARGKDGMKFVDYETGKMLQIPPPLLLPVEKIPEVVTGGTGAVKASYAEFFRAYVAGFAHYFFLELKFNKTPFLPQLIKTMNQMRAAGPMNENSFHEAVKKVTNKPLGTNADPKSDWEGSWLEWLDTKG